MGPGGSLRIQGRMDKKIETTSTYRGYDIGGMEKKVETTI